jgi:hypothetical protein
MCGELLRDDLARYVLAAAAAAAHWELALHFKERARALIDALPDLTVTYGVADADVHSLSPSLLASPWGAPNSRVMVIANKNDCQLHHWSGAGGTAVQRSHRLGLVPAAPQPWAPAAEARAPPVYGPPRE